ncbi:DUF7002 family protein [Chloroflexota bacterium]
MKIEELLDSCQYLYHMAEDGSWPNIEKYGLLSTSALLTLYKKTGSEREQYESEWRHQRMPISCEGMEDACLRDQIPMPPEELKKCLQGGIEPRVWYEFINKRIFFWTTWESLEIFLAAKEYKNKPQTVIKVNTKLLLDMYSDLVTLSSINSGSTYYNPERYSKPQNRSFETFQKIENYHAPWIRELVVENGVPDIANLTVSVDRWTAHRINYEKPNFEKLEHIWP